MNNSNSDGYKKMKCFLNKYLKDEIKNTPRFLELMETNQLNLRADGLSVLYSHETKCGELIMFNRRFTIKNHRIRIFKTRKGHTSHTNFSPDAGPMLSYDMFWKRKIENKKGSIDKENLAEILSNYSDLIRKTQRLYSIITGGKIISSSACINEVVNAVNERYTDKN